MAAKDKFHEVLKNALVKDGWTVTDDPYVLKIGGKKQEIDFGAEKIIAAEKDGKKIAVELKSFLSDSPFNDFYEALGQYISYEIGLSLQEPERIPFLAINQMTAHRLEKYEAIQIAFERQHVRLLIFDVETETIVSWQQ
ncbi:MAG: XisH family protein [Phycisphaerae bacterium]|nr:XisH family protein [Saprospiraceae bacterium]